MSKKNNRSITVTSSERTTEHMQRVEFNGEDLSDFPRDSASGYIKILFSRDGEALSAKNQVEELSPVRSLMRTYTARHYNAENNKLTVDFVLHKHNGNGGPASLWAQSSKPRDTLNTNRTF